MSSRQMTEAIAFYQLEPFGFYQSGIIASTIANAFRGKKSQSFSPENFAIRPSKEGRPRKESATSMKQKLMQLVGMSGGKKDG